MVYNIYTLTCPLSNSVVYVGMTIQDVEARLMGHINERYSYNISKLKYFDLLKSKGLTPTCDIIETSNSKKQAIDLELYWIHQFKAWGFNLLNKGRIKDRKKLKHNLK